MSEDDLQLLITLDDPVDAPEEDTFNHLQAKNAIEYWLGQPLPAWDRLDQPAEADGDNDVYKVTFGQGDWTCTLSRLAGTTKVPMTDGNVIEPPDKKLDIEVCTVTRWKNGEIVEQKVFYDLVGMQKQMGVL
jgi:hypothetical protein